MKTKIKFLLLLLFFFFGSMLPPDRAFAYTYTVSLNYNNMGLTGSEGTITVSDISTGDVQIGLIMNSGYSLKIQDGNDFNFNSNYNISSFNIDSMTISGTTYSSGLTATQKGGQNADGLGSFSMNLAGITCGSCPSGTASVDQLVFDVIGGNISAANLATPNALGVSWAVHICNASGGGCGTTTGYAGNVAPVPLPGTALLIATGIAGLGLVHLKRNRFNG